MDGTYINSNAQSATATALKNMGMKFLRYPGGEKSDNYLWATSPYSHANPIMALTGSCQWPSGDGRFVNSDYLTYVFNSPYGVQYAKGNISSKGGSAGNFNLGE